MKDRPTSAVPEMETQPGAAGGSPGAMTSCGYAEVLAPGSAAAGAEEERRHSDAGNRLPSQATPPGLRSSAEAHVGRRSAGLRVAVGDGQLGRPRIRGLLRRHVGRGLIESPTPENYFPEPVAEAGLRALVPAAATVAMSVGPAVKSDQRRCASGSSGARWRVRRVRPTWRKRCCEQSSKKRKCAREDESEIAEMEGTGHVKAPTVDGNKVLSRPHCAEAGSGRRSLG